MFNSIKKYFRGIKKIESIRAHAYAQGQEDASSKFISQHKSMTNKIQELTNQNIAIEKRLRESADQRVVILEKMQQEKCKSCRRNLEEERKRLMRRQNILADKITKFDEIWLQMYQHANNIIDEHDVLLRSSSRLVASRNILMDYKKRVDNIMEEAIPLLSVELQDGTMDKKVDVLKNTEVPIVINETINPNINKKENGKK